MKFIFTLVGLLFLVVKAPAQKVPDLILKSGTPGPAPTITIRSDKSADYREALLVVDGIVYELDHLQKIDPNDIESITILKLDTSVKIYCGVMRPVIVVTTKSTLIRKFIIKDFLIGNNIPKATICFTSGNDSIKAAANDSGILVTDKLKAGVKYDITVSSAGYKTFSTLVKGKEQEILLEKDVKTCSEVIVSSYPIRCGRICHHSFSCASKGIKIDSIPDTKLIISPGNKLSALIFPNPVQRNNRFNIELENVQSEIVQIAIISLNGSMVLRQSQQVNKGLNHLSITPDARWAAGIYNIQLRNEKGTLVRQEKLVVQ